jgi:transposase
MRRLKIQDEEIMRIAVQEEIMRSGESRYDHRLHGILLICAGFSCYQVANLFGHSPRTVEYWVKRFEESGFAGLDESPHSGRPSVLSETDLASVGKHLRCNPRDFGYSQNLWDGKLLSHHLKQTLGVKIGVRQCQRLFRKLGFRRRKPRPVIAKADSQVQEEYKKNSTD